MDKTIHSAISLALTNIIMMLPDDKPKTSLTLILGFLIGVFYSLLCFLNYVTLST